MSIKPLLLCGAGLLALQLLAVRADTVTPLEIPKGWSASDSIGKQYITGYDSRENAYFIVNTGPIEPAGRAVNAETAPSNGSHRVPYSEAGLKPSDAWTASLLQSVKGAPYRNHKIKFEAEVKSADFKGKFLLLLRAFDADHSWTTTTNTSLGPLLTIKGPGIDLKSVEWQSLSGEIDEADFPAENAEKSVLTFGFLVQGEGKVLIRNAKLIDEGVPHPAKPETTDTKLWEMFGDPTPAEQPVNLELQR